jgi:hypothetical protein
MNDETPDLLAKLQREAAAEAAIFDPIQATRDLPNRKGVNDMNNPRGDHWPVQPDGGDVTSPAEKAANAIAELNAINHYIETQMALGNWPYDNVWDGDVVILALVDTYEAVGEEREIEAIDTDTESES